MQISAGAKQSLAEILKLREGRFYDPMQLHGGLHSLQTSTCPRQLSMTALKLLKRIICESAPAMSLPPALELELCREFEIPQGGRWMRKMRKIQESFDGVTCVTSSTNSSRHRPLR